MNCGGSLADNLQVTDKGVTDYADLCRRMDHRTSERLQNRYAATDECWITRHHSVYTLGRRADARHLKENPEHIPVLRTDRGGGITWHGPGQIIFYLLLDIRRKGWSVKHLVSLTEEAIISFLSRLGISGHRRPSMPGVYVCEEKIASLGFRIRQGCCYHGLSFNLCPNLKYFARMDTCGYAGLRVTSLAKLGADLSQAECERGILAGISSVMCYNIRYETD